MHPLFCLFITEKNTAGLYCGGIEAESRGRKNRSVSIHSDAAKSENERKLWER